MAIGDLIRKQQELMLKVPLCACGCGQPVLYCKYKFLKGHSRRKLNREQENSACQLYEGGASTPELSKRFGLTDTNIWRILKRRGIKIRTLSEANRTVSLAARDKIVSMYSEGCNPVDIAASQGVTFQEVYLILHEKKVVLRRPKYYYNGPKGIIMMRSSWEIEIARWLDFLRLDWLYEPRKFKTSEGNYIPDFYVPEFDCYVEIKGQIDRVKKSTAFVKEHTDKTLFMVCDVGLFGKLFLAQRLLEKGFGHNVNKMDDKDRLAYFKDQMLMFYAELAEMLQEWPWKAHKQYTTGVNREKFLGEAVDCLIFLINATAALEGVTERDIIEGMKTTETKNFLRQRKGYAGSVGKDLEGSDEWKDHLEPIEAEPMEAELMEEAPVKTEFDSLRRKLGSL